MYEYVKFPTLLKYLDVFKQPMSMVIYSIIKADRGLDLISYRDLNNLEKGVQIVPLDLIEESFKDALDRENLWNYHYGSPVFIGRDKKGEEIDCPECARKLCSPYICKEHGQIQVVISSSY